MSGVRRMEPSIVPRYSPLGSSSQGRAQVARPFSINHGEQRPMESEQQCAGTGEISCREAGRRGGRKVAQTYGKDHFQSIGRKAGMTTKARHGVEHYTKIGSLGGSATARKHGVEHYQKIGRHGGARVRELIDRAKQMEAAE